MTNIEWFKFENQNLDFPFYRKNPHVPKWGWVVLFVVMLLGLLLSMSSKIHITALSCIVIIVPVLYFLKWDWRAIFQMPKARDVGLAVALCIGYFIYSTAISFLLGYAGITSGGTINAATVDLMSTAASVFSIMTEEFVKFIPFMFFLRVLFKYTGRRKLSVAASVVIVMVFFASLHAYSFTMFLFALCIQGLGSVFEFYGYIKTKNVMVSYITHLLTDLVIYSTILLGL